MACRSRKPISLRAQPTASAGPNFGNSYGAFKWQTATAMNDVVNLLSAPFYDVTAKDNGTTYAACIRLSTVVRLLATSISAWLR